MWKMPVRFADVPMAPHPGAFGVQRKHEIHTGVDLYADEGTHVAAVEDGIVVGIEWFTGPDSDPPSSWWLPTKAVLVEGESGVVLYGELKGMYVATGDRVTAGHTIGTVARVLRHDKRLPMSMLHLELHKPGTKASTHPWTQPDQRPESLMDPTPFLREIK